MRAAVDAARSVYALCRAQQTAEPLWLVHGRIRSGSRTEKRDSAGRPLFNSSSSKASKYITNHLFLSLAFASQGSLQRAFSYLPYLGISYATSESCPTAAPETTPLIKPLPTL